MVYKNNMDMTKENAFKIIDRCQLPPVIMSPVACRSNEKSWYLLFDKNYQLSGIIITAVHRFAALIGHYSELFLC